MKRLASLLSTGMLAMIVTVDQSSNVTNRVLDDSIVPAIERVLPYSAPDGFTYDKQAVDKHRTKSLHLSRKHCSRHLKFLGKQDAGCGYVGD